MPNNNRAAGAQLAHGSDAACKFWGEDNTPPAVTPQLFATHYQSPRHTPICDHCDRQVLRLFRHVDRLGGGCSDACRACFLRLAATEAHAKLVANWHGLFRQSCPRTTWSGGMFASFADTSTGTNTTTEQADPDPDSEPLCECGSPLADNFSPHTDRCDICRRYRPAPPPINPAPDAEPYATTLTRLTTATCARRTERRLCYAAR